MPVPIHCATLNIYTKEFIWETINKTGTKKKFVKRYIYFSKKRSILLVSCVGHMKNTLIYVYWRLFVCIMSAMRWTNICRHQFNYENTVYVAEKYVQLSAQIDIRSDIPHCVLQLFSCFFFNNKQLQLKNMFIAAYSCACNTESL